MILNIPLHHSIPYKIERHADDTLMGIDITITKTNHIVLAFSRLPNRRKRPNNGRNCGGYQTQWGDPLPRWKLGVCCRSRAVRTETTASLLCPRIRSVDPEGNDL